MTPIELRHQTRCDGTVDAREKIFKGPARLDAGTQESSAESFRLQISKAKSAATRLVSGRSGRAEAEEGFTGELTNA